jgi:hypothetical protein
VVSLQVYMHGGMSVATGHGCLSDLWVFNVQTCTWSAAQVAAVHMPLPSQLAASRVAPVAACQHAMAVDASGAVLLFGGNVRAGNLNDKMQVLVPLLANVPGGAPQGLRMVTRIRPAGTLAVLALCRCAARSICHSAGLHMPQRRAALRSCSCLPALQASLK